MTDAYWAGPEEKEEIIEFIDYVFSKAHRPHDFASLLPKLYGEHGDGAAHHFVVREEGKLAATVLVYPVTMRIGERTLTTLGVGSVSTHPQARGRGYMRLLMDAVDVRAKETGAAFAVLGGQRQRYQYFGYDYAGYELHGRFTPDNARHALRTVDAADYDVMPMTQVHVPQAAALLERQSCFCARSGEAYLDILRSWNNEPFALRRGGRPVGFGALRQNEGNCHLAELLLEDEADFPAAMKLLSARYGALTVCAAPWEKQRARWMSSVCEEVAVQPNHQFKFYDEEQVRAACAALDGFLPMKMALPVCVTPPDCV